MLNQASSNIAKVNYEAPIQTFVALTRAAIDSGEKLVALNLRHTRSRLDESSDAIRDLLSATDPQTYAALAASRAQPELNRALEHCRELTGIASAMQASVVRILSASLQAGGTK